MYVADLRFKTLRHIASINAGGHGARCPYGEMIREADALIREGLSEWREDRCGLNGRWLTEAGRSALRAEGDGE